MISEEAVMNVLVIGIQVVKDYVGVARVTGCENDDFEVFTEVFEDVLCMRSDVDTSFNDLTSWKSDG